MVGLRALHIAASMLMFLGAALPWRPAHANSCTSDKSKAQTTCTAQDMPPIQNGETAETGSSAQCKAQQSAAQTNSSNLSAQATKCSEKIKTCEQSCQQLITQGRQSQPPNQALIQQGTQGKQACSALKEKQAQLAQQASREAGRAGTSGQCKEGSGTQMAMPNLPQIPTPTMPTLPQMPTPGDPCADASMKKSLPQCATNGVPEAAKIVMQDGGRSPSATTAKDNSAPILQPGIGGAPSNGVASNGNSGSSGGSGIPLGSGTSAVPVDAKNDKVSTAAKGSGSSDGGGGGGGGGGFGGRGFAPSEADLQDFQKKLAQKSVSGMTIKPVDGITGPLGESIFEKVTKQYRLQTRIMVP